MEYQPRNLAMGNAFRSVATALKNETDRGTVVLAVAWLDESLTNVIKKLFQSTDQEDLLNPGQALGDLGTKILLAQRLKLINPSLVKSLTICRRLRNDFAHLSSELSFSTPSVKDRVQNLFDTNESIISSMGETLQKSGMNFMQTAEGGISVKGIHNEFGTRLLFQFTCAFINSGLAAIEYDTQQINPSFDEPNSK